MDNACSSMAKKLIPIKRMSLFIACIEGWNVELASLIAFLSPAFKIMDKTEHLTVARSIA